MKDFRYRPMGRALSCVLGGLLLAAAGRAQDPGTAPAPNGTGTADASPLVPVFDVYFEPFNISPLDRLRVPRPGEGITGDAEPLPPLIPPFDPISTPQAQTPLERYAITSRVMLPGQRDIASLDVVEGKVGEEVDVSLRTNNTTGTVGFRLVFRYDPKVVKPVSADVNNWPVQPNLMTNFDPESTGYILVFTDQVWKTPDILTTIRFRITGPGESLVEATAYELADTGYDLVLTVFRDGLIRATP